MTGTHNNPISVKELTPHQTVAELDKYVIGQNRAKRAVATALRNRFRRRQLPAELREDIRPKNLLLIGPTGVGKTEIARRIAGISGIPFVKVEATKFTEVGYVGRDVDSMIRDLVDVSMNMLRGSLTQKLSPAARKKADERILDLLVPESRRFHPLSGFEKDLNESSNMPIVIEETDSTITNRQQIAEQLQAGKLEEKEIEIDMSEQAIPMVEIVSSQSGLEEMGLNLQGLQSMLGSMLPTRHRRKRVKVGEAREIFFQEELNSLLDQEDLHKSAIDFAQETGVIFLDEIDKIASSYSSSTGPDVSREGVQRDLLPLVEGTSVMTKYGMIKTDHILFFAAGAFNVSKPSDLIPELQGRFPVRVEFDKLSASDFKRILTEPRNSLTKQYMALLQIDGLEIEFTEDAIDRIAQYAHEANLAHENIGARRLHTIMEQLMDEASFAAPEKLSGKLRITAAEVEKSIAPLMQNRDLARFIL
jgi:ATP-dependent HslUV protease ATP-binding subunit HslU